ncbi:hypothetical protein LguiA_033673 [Lonicera macranthoides]
MTVFPEENFNSTSPVPATIVMWESPNNTFLSSASECLELSMIIVDMVRSTSGHPPPFGTRY